MQFFRCKYLALEGSKKKTLTLLMGVRKISRPLGPTLDPSVDSP